MKEILRDIFLIEVPLPGSPLKILNSYLVRGADRHLLIDVGYNNTEGEAVLENALQSLGLRWEDTDIFLTHLHGDHSGLVDRLKHRCGKIFISHFDGDDINQNYSDAYWDRIMAAQDKMGTPKEERLAAKDHPGYTGGTRTFTSFSFVENHDEIKVGRYTFEVLDLKGHTPGQKGLYEKEEQILFCGDHILNKITPNITTWDFQQDYLGLFLSSLEMVRAMDLKLVLPGHRALITNHKQRVDELIQHHEKRLEGIKALLAQGEKTIYEIARGIKWDFGNSNYADFPNEQKWFAGNEVFAHMEHLTALGEVSYDVRGDTYYYRLI